MTGKQQSDKAECPIIKGQIIGTLVYNTLQAPKRKHTCLVPAVSCVGVSWVESMSLEVHCLPGFGLENYRSYSTHACHF